jgi:catechol-2,3-dioxygenase
MQYEIERLLDGLQHGRLTRRQAVARLTGLFAAAAAGRAIGAAGDEAPGLFKATDINHIALSVTDVARSAAFYQKQMGLAPMSAGERSSFLRCGNDFLALFKADRPGMDHFCFTVEGYEPADAVKRLQGAGLNPRRQADRVYFDDPDGLEVQVSAPNQ